MSRPCMADRGNNFNPMHDNTFFWWSGRHVTRCFSNWIKESPGICSVRSAQRFAMLQLSGSGPTNHIIGLVRTVGPSALPLMMYLCLFSSAWTSSFCFIQCTELLHETRNSVRKSTAPARDPKFCCGYLTLKDTLCLLFLSSESCANRLVCCICVVLW